MSKKLLNDWYKLMNVMDVFSALWGIMIVDEPFVVPVIFVLQDVVKYLYHSFQHLSWWIFIYLFHFENKNKNFLKSFMVEVGKKNAK